MHFRFYFLVNRIQFDFLLESNAFSSFLRLVVFGRVCKIVCTSLYLTAWNNSAHTGWTFMKFVFENFSKTSRKIETLFKSDINNENLNKDLRTLTVISRLNFLRMIYQKKSLEKIKIPFLYSIFLPPNNLAVYEIM